MKKLYHLDESEKERIIKLHQDRTKQQYLNESPQLVLEFLPLVAWAGIAAATAIGGWAYDKFNNGVNTNDSNKFINNVQMGCNDPNIQKYVQDNQNNDNTSKAESIATTIQNALGNRGSSLSTQQSTQISSALSSIPAIPQFCLVLDVFKRRNGDDMIKRIRDQYYYQNAFMADIQTPIQAILDRQVAAQRQEEGGGAQGNKEGWKNYPCLDSAKKMEDGTTKVMKTNHGRFNPKWKMETHYFMPDGTFLTENDDEKGVEQSGTFKCSRSGKIMLTYEEDTEEETGGSEKKKEKKNDGTKPTPTISLITGPWGKATTSSPKLLSTSTIDQSVINDMANKLGIK
jgi:hypothetical protein